MFLTVMARLIAVLLSVAAAVISVIGLAAIFSGAYVEIIVVASLLEAAKVITATWLHSNWTQISSKLKVYLSIAVIALMCITSLGIYGFLARAHIKQQVAMETGEVSKLPAIESKINIEREKIADLEKQISQIDNGVAAMTQKGKARDAKKAIDEAAKQRKTRDSFVAEKAKALEAVGLLEVEKAQVEGKVKAFEVEVGPLKYIAAAWYGGDASKDQLEAAVRILILALIFVFDPLAIALLVAANSMALKSRKAVEVPATASFVPPVFSETKTVIDGGVIDEAPRKKRKYTRRKKPGRKPVKKKPSTRREITKRKLDNPKVVTGSIRVRRPRRDKENTLDLSKVNLE